jgi:CRP-like cAMP-binding protein
MAKTLDETRLLQFKNNLSSCVNVKRKMFYNKDLILSYAPIKKKIGFITYGKANIVKMDKNGNTTIMRDLKENDIFSNLFFQDSEDEIYIMSNGETEVIFIDYYTILKNCNKQCPFHNKLVLALFDLLILDNKQQNEKIELLSKRTVEEKILYFLKQRMNENNIFKVTTSYKAISEYLFVDRSNLMRELKKMEDKGLIEKHDKTIIIKDSQN